jgi:hypothetical protein
MNEHNTDNKHPLHLNADPELSAIESLLDELGQADRDAMPAHIQSGLLEAVSGVFAPQPIAIERAIPRQRPDRPAQAWKFRVAAAAFLATATTLSIVAIKPWSSPTPIQQDSGQSSWSLASFEQDFDAYLALEEVGDDTLDDAVANWELWAQTIDTDFDSELLGSDLGLTDFNDGAL